MDVVLEEALVGASLGNAYASVGRSAEALETLARSKELLAIGDAAWPISIIEDLERAIRDGRLGDRPVVDPGPGVTR